MRDLVICILILGLLWLAAEGGRAKKRSLDEKIKYEVDKALRNKEEKK